MESGRVMVSSEEVISLFPSDKFRKYQKEVLKKINDSFNSGVRCILLEAPTGFGKSIVNVTMCRAYEPAFYATPQLNLIDQMKRDRYIGLHLTEIKGRRNYYCVYDPIATCDVGLCYRQAGFDCKKTEVCHYWKAKIKALNSPIALMSFAYFLLEGRTEGNQYSFGNRNLLVLDESHSIDRHVINHVNLVVSPYVLPGNIYRNISRNIRHFVTIEELKDFVASTTELVSSSYHDYEIITLDGKVLTVEQGLDKLKAENFVSKSELFLNTCDDLEWIWDIQYTTSRTLGLCKVLVAQPVFAHAFMNDMIWKRANKFIVSSATILDPTKFIRETGINLSMKSDEILHLRIPSTFPVEHRKIVNSANGKLTRKTRDENLPIAVKILETILDTEKGNVAVHVHSYDMAVSIMNIIDSKYKERIITHTPETRKDALRRFENERGNVFICVAFEEGYDWAYDMCTAQVLFKVPYPDINDKRVARRLSKHDWHWYRLEALKTVIQAYGRAVRSEEDVANFYIVDASFIDLIKNEKKYVPEWFKEALPDEWKNLVKQQ